VLYLCGRFPSRSHLCYAGGVALNSVANERILRESGFKNVFIMPAAEDSGTAIGAAYYGLWQLRGYSPIPQQTIDETGRRYSRAEITSVIERTPALCVSQPDDLVDHVAELLSRGNIVGWFRGGSELGPRSLGQRSIFCDPRKPDMKHILNSRVKFREGFRPFAPMVRYENVHEWFDVEEHQAYSPFMLRVMPFREEKKELVPAVVHVDGTGRVQTVARQTAPVLHRLLTAFYDRTGVPMLLNTSFNVAGEPIVETPKDAVLGFLYTGIDFCVVEEQLLSKLADCDPILDCPLQILSQWATLSSASGGDCLRFEVPPLDGATQSVDSVHVSRAAEMDLAIYRSRQSRLKLITRTPWGLVLHALPGSAAHILAHVDGTRTGRQIYDRLCACGLVGGDPETALATFRRELGLLWRAGAVWFAAGNAAANLSLARSA
jgi:carbamoyltransferase